MTLDLLHSLIRRPQANDRAEVSMSVHIQHLGSEIPAIPVFRCDDCAASKLRDTSRREPSIHLISRPITVDHHLPRVDILSGFQLQCPIASAHEISAGALCLLCMSRKGFRTPLAHFWAFSGEEHRFAHNRTVLTVFSWTKHRFLIRNSRFPIAHQEIAQDCNSPKLALDNRLSKSFASGLTRNPRSVLLNSLPRNFVSDPSCGQLVFNKRILPTAIKVLSRASSGPTNTPSSMCLHIMTLVSFE